jgi:hypothetical protein
MATCWEAFSFNKKVETLNEKSFLNYRTAIIKDSDSIDRVIGSEQTSSGAIMSVKRDAIPSVTPPAKRFHAASQETASSAESTSVDRMTTNRRVSLSPGPPILMATLSALGNVPKYSERQGVGKVVATFNPNNFEALPPNVATTRCRISYDFDTNAKASYRHLFTPLQERAKALDRHTMKLSEAMIQRYNLGTEKEGEVAPLESVGVPRQDVVCCIGRICSSVCTATLTILDTKSTIDLGQPLTIVYFV